jgi:CHASE2 domain-containing sensor protein
LRHQSNQSSRERRHTPRWRALAAALLVALAAGGAAAATGILAAPEQATLAARFRVRHVPRPDDVAVVGIDDVTFSDLHVQWPFPRSLHARVIDRLHAAGAREIVYDTQFTEPTTDSEDMALYQAVADAGGAVLSTAETDGHGHTAVLGGDANLARIGAQAGASNMPGAYGGSIVDFPYSFSGLKSLAVVAAERVTGRPVPRRRFPGGRAMIDYRGGPGTFPTLSFAAVMRGQFDPRAVRGKIVVVGALSPTLQDVHPTPTGGSALMAGPEVEANAIWTALHGEPLSPAPLTLDLLLALALAAAPLLARRRLGVVASTAVGVLAAAAFLVGAQLAFDSGTVLAVAGPLLTAAAATVAMLAASHLSESGARREASATNERLTRDVRQRTEELEDTQLEVVRRLAGAVESRDLETGHHVERISILSERLGLAIGMNAHEAEMLRHAAALHDIGKIGIPDRILLKPGPLDLDEWKTMKTHTTIGADLLAGSRSPFLQLAEVIARTHHERWDGSGYPAGLAGEEIPLSGRICALCDVYDAIVSARPYKPPHSEEQALAEIQRCSGTQFDPSLVEKFVRIAREPLAEWGIAPAAFTHAPR